MATLKKSAYEVAVRKQEQFLFKNTREKKRKSNPFAHSYIKKCEVPLRKCKKKV